MGHLLTHWLVYGFKQSNNRSTHNSNRIFIIIMIGCCQNWQRRDILVCIRISTCTAIKPFGIHHNVCVCNQNLWKFEFLIGFGILNFVSIVPTKIIVLDELCDTATVENAYVISNNTSLELYLLCRTVSVTNKPICISYACASPCVCVYVPEWLCVRHTDAIYDGEPCTKSLVYYCVWECVP